MTDKKIPLVGCPLQAANKNIKTNNTRLHLSPTLTRIVILLLIKPEISYDLERKACCRYAADNIQQLRQKGINIITTMVDYIRSVDGKKVKVGQYSIASESLEIARIAVKSEG